MLIAISVIPAALKTSQTSIYSLRAALAYPLLCGVIGWGCYFCWNKISVLKQKYKLARKFSLAKIFLSGVVIVYILSLVYFLVMYWYRIPKDQSTRWFFHKRVLTNYITRIQNTSDKKIIVVTARPDGIFNTFIFYSGIYNDKNTIKKINNGYLLRNFEYKGAKFIDDCIEITESERAMSIIFIDQINRGKCEIEQKNSSMIANPRDGGGIFIIINESLCLNYPQNRYPNPRSIYDFKLEKMTDEAFCKMWVTNPG